VDANKVVSLGAITIRIARAYMAELGEGMTDGEVVDAFVAEMDRENKAYGERLVEAFVKLKKEATRGR
jgi:hypothetical protein